MRRQDEGKKDLRNMKVRLQVVFEPVREMAVGIV
jgi:hypothetical protein